jgi:hypothetical protein
VSLDGLELPRDLEREVALDRDHRYEINGDESRTLPATGAFRVVSERDLRDPRDRVFNAGSKSSPKCRKTCIRDHKKATNW